MEKHHPSIGKWESNINQPSIEETFKLTIIFDVDWKKFILTDLSIKENKYDEEIKKIASDNGVEIIIDKNAPLIAQSVVDIQKILMKELDKDNNSKKSSMFRIRNLRGVNMFILQKKLLSNEVNYIYIITAIT